MNMPTVKNNTTAFYLICLVAFCTALICTPTPAAAQNPVQWSGSVKQSVDRALEQSLPLLFWVKEGSTRDNNDLEDAQEDSFRDPMVVDIIHKHFVPVRVNRNSRVIEEASKLGLPTNFGLYCAVLTTDGVLLAEMGPGEVANPEVFASKLNAAYNKHVTDLYEKDLKSQIANLQTPKPQARLAVQKVWKLDIKSADADIINLLKREDLTPTETQRIYELLASLSTKASIETLLTLIDDTRESSATQSKGAQAALLKAKPSAIEFLLPALPPANAPADTDSKLTPAQLAAYTALARLSRTTANTSQWWAHAKPDDQQKELNRVKAKAIAIFEYSQGQPSQSNAQDSK